MSTMMQLTMRALCKYNTALDLVSQIEHTVLNPDGEPKDLHLRVAILQLRNAIYWELKQEEQRYEYFKDVEKKP